jgi:ATP-dependent Clp protease ATP-binding subunit ClpC
VYERFTDQARRVFEEANNEAVRFGHSRIDTEHILAGLIQQVSGVAAEVLKEFGVDLDKIRREVEQLRAGVSGATAATKLPMTPWAKKAVECAMEEARHLSQDYVGPEHILLGLLHEQGRVADQVLTNLGLSLDEAREKVRSRG